MLLLFHAAPRELRFPALLLGSLAFYFYGENWLIIVMIASTVIDYICGLMIAKGGRGRSGARLVEGGARTAGQRAWLAASIVCNLGLLGCFKYLSFLADNVIALLAALNLAHLRMESAVRIALPLGISFYTFQSMSYTIDVYRGRVTANRSLLQFSTYVTMFPQLVAGPIVRYADIDRALRHPVRSVTQFADGVRRFIGGLAKKVLIANPMALVADRVFGMPEAELTAGIVWSGVAAYTLQIYFDFSGYSCMAIGLGKMFGFDFPENFNYPYISRSVRDFWHRWHITLSTWFRDYVYFPLGGSRGSEAKTWRNLIIVFVTCGLWHGASWNFVVWGLFHGVFLSLERTRAGALLARMPSFIRHAYLLLVVMVGWILFRCDSMSHAWALARRLVPHEPSGLRSTWEVVGNDGWIVMAIGVALSMPLVPWMRLCMDRMSGICLMACELAWMAALASLLAACVMSLTAGGYNPFIYFRF